MTDPLTRKRLAGFATIMDIFSLPFSAMAPMLHPDNAGGWAAPKSATCLLLALLAGWLAVAPLRTLCACPA